MDDLELWGSRPSLFEGSADVQPGREHEQAHDPSTAR